MSDGIFIAEYDMNSLRDYRRNEMMGNTFRKVGAYAKILDGHIEEPFIRNKCKKYIFHTQILTHAQIRRRRKVHGY